MASCPACGFDLAASGKCPVCGFDFAQPAVSPLAAPEADESSLEMVGAGTRAVGGRGEGAPARAQSGRSVEAEPPRGGRTGKRLSLVGAVIVVFALLGVGGFFLFGANAGEGAESAATASRTPRAAAADAQAAGGERAGALSQAGAPGSVAGGTREASISLATAAGAALPQVGEGGGGAQSGVATYSDPAVERSLSDGTSDLPSDYRAIDLTPVTPRDAAPAYDITKRTEFPPLTSEEAYVAWMLAHYPGEQKKFLEERWARATLALERGHIRHERILMGFLLTPREWFVRAANINRTYENVAMPIGYGQTISGPDLVARMTDYLNPQPEQRVLEIGTGSGYQSAFLSELSDHVYTIEIVKPLAEETNAIYVAHTQEMPEYANIHRRIADGYYGWRENAPFDRIIVTCGIDHIPPDLIKELAPDGIMVIPIGPPSGQTILKITKHVGKNGRITLTREDIYHGMAKDIFVPFTAVGGGVHSLNTDVKR